MKCVICRTGAVHPATVEAEIKAGCDRLLFVLEAERLGERGEAYYSAEHVRKLERVREALALKEITAESVGQIYRVP